MKPSLIYGHQHNRGAVLIVLLVALLAGSGLWLLEVAQANRQWQRHREATAESLGFAKEALIAYAVSYADNYGHNVRGGAGRLPCPSGRKHSSPGLSCGEGRIGYLPAVWSRGNKRLDIDHIEKFLDQDLWYSVTPTHRYNPSFNTLNSDSITGLLAVDQIDDVVAVIIAPGPPLPGQDRLRVNASVADYLEGENADLDRQFTTADSVGHQSIRASDTNSSNDQLIWIRQSELMPLMEKRVLGYVKQWLNEYYLKYDYYPYAAPFEDLNGNCQVGLTSGRLPMGQGSCTELPLGEFVSESVEKSRPLSDIWFSGSLWQDLIHYQVDPACTAGGSIAECENTNGNGTLVVDGERVKVLLVSAGAATESTRLGRLQSRAIDNRSLPEYFEVPDLLTAGTVVTFKDIGLPFNDQFIVIE